MNKMNLLVYALTAAGLISALGAQSSAVSTISITLCGLVTGVRSIVGALAIVLFLLGGVLYAVAHFLPTSLEYRKSLIGWSQAMIVGGIIGLVVVLLAQPIVGLFTTIGVGVGGTTGTGAITC
jgi:hypothetical protein